MKAKTHWNFFIKKNTFAIFAIVIQIVGVAIFNYSDCNFFTTASINIWDALYHGRITEYFLLTAENSRRSIVLGNPHGILYLLPWAIWNLPIWLTHIDINAPVNTPLCLFWSKLFLVVCSVVTANYAKKIISLFVDVDSKLLNLCYVYILGTGTLLISVAYSGQDEIVYICAFITGLYYFFIEKYKKSIPLMSLSILLCPYMILPVCITIFTRFKKISYAVYIGLAAILPEKIVSWVCGLSNLEQYISEGYAFYGKYTFITLLDWFFNRTRIPSGTGLIQVFSCLLVLLLGYCLVKQFKTRREENIFVINSVSFFLIFLITIVAWSHAYRFYIGIPFLVISVFISGISHKDLSFGLFLLVIFDLLRSLICVANDYIFILKANFIFQNFINSYYSLFTFINEEIINVDVFFDTLCSITVGVYFLLLYYVKSNRNTICYHIKIAFTNILSILVPAGLLFIYITLVFLCSATTQKTSDNFVLLNEESSFIQKYIPNTNKINRLFVRQDVNYNSPGDQLFLDIIDYSSGNKLCSKKILLPQSEYIKIKIKDVDVISGNSYGFRFYGTASNKNNIKLFLGSEKKSNGIISKIIEKPF